jgi:hypothetical protein
MLSSATIAGACRSIDRYTWRDQESRHRPWRAHCQYVYNIDDRVDLTSDEGNGTQVLLLPRVAPLEAAAAE